MSDLRMDFTEDQQYLLTTIQSARRSSNMAGSINKLFREKAFTSIVLADNKTFMQALEMVLASGIAKPSSENTKSTITIRYQDAVGPKEDIFAYDIVDGKPQFFPVVSAEKYATTMPGMNRNLEDFSDFLFSTLKSDPKAELAFSA